MYKNCSTMKLEQNSKLLFGTNCCEVMPIEKLIYFTAEPCKLRNIRTSLKIQFLQSWATRDNICLIAIISLKTFVHIFDSISPCFCTKLHNQQH